MKNTQKLSNSFLIYSAIILSILIYIFGIFSVVNFANEVNEIGFLAALSEHFISISLGIICLFLIAPSYRLTKSLRILEVTDYENGTSILTVYSPFFISYLPQVEKKEILQNLKKVSQNSYFSKLVELEVEDDSSERIIKSFLGPRSLKKLKNT